MEIACMRPVEAKGVPLIPERGDDERVARLNRLMRDVAESDPEHVTFMPGPKEWCANPAISNSVGYRWDGVHLYKPGAKLLIPAIAKPPPPVSINGWGRRPTPPATASRLSCRPTST